VKIIRLTAENGNTDSLLNQINGRVFHLTTATAFAAIRNSGKVLHNRAERFPLNTSSKQSFGRLMGYVCLFDLRDHSRSVFQRILDDYYFLGPPWFETECGRFMVSQLAYLILHPSYHGRLIANKAGHDHMRTTGQYLHFIPNGEVWIDNHLPLDWIDTVISATIRRPISQMERIVLRVDNLYRKRNLST
jgi:hypothetical protein